MEWRSELDNIQNATRRKAPLRRAHPEMLVKVFKGTSGVLVARWLDDHADADAAV